VGGDHVPSHAPQRGNKGGPPFVPKRGGAYKTPCVTAMSHSCTSRGGGEKGLPWEEPCPLWFCVSCNRGLGGKKGGCGHKRGEARARWQKAMHVKGKDGSNLWRDVAHFPTPRITVSGHTIFFPKSNLVAHSVTFPPHVTSASAIEKGKWLEWRDTPERMDSSGSNRPVEPDLDLDDEESFIVGRLVSADVIEHETDHAPDYGNYGVISSHLALS
jgi:hypothetical protein